MRRILPVAPALFAFFLATPALPQSEDGRDPVPEVGQDVERGDAPVIIDRTRGPKKGEDGEIIRSELDTFVQIQGAWAADEAACATVGENGGAGLYLTDTLIRWEEATCSIRNIDAQDESATIHALCATSDGRRDRTFNVEVEGEDRLSLAFQAGGEQQKMQLTRCEAGR